MSIKPKNLIKIFIGMSLFIYSCSTCPDLDKYYERYIGFEIQIDDSFTPSEIDTIIMKKNWLDSNYYFKRKYTYDTFLLDNNQKYQALNGEKMIFIKMPNTEYAGKEFLSYDTIWINFNAFKYVLVGVQQHVKISGRCGTKKTVLKKNIWLNDIKINLQENQILNKARVKNGALILSKI